MDMDIDDGKGWDILIMNYNLKTWKEKKGKYDYTCVL